ncbi:hypothetical protein Taro_023896 [Colocasia esculenta]|uniref:Uncharacterized protein n=1 Tax=Colocasia esculenta TaxID=4460 RepID=A0A843VC50_COLES|nr:hypothetical protein [Colocasia esculenta]
MAASGSSGSVGGYSPAFLTVDQLERYQAVKIKLCGNKAVDLDDLGKHGEALLAQGELLWGFSKQFEVLEVRGACSHRKDVAWSGGNANGSLVFAFFAKCGTVEVCVVFLDTFTPMFEFYMYWAPASPVLVPHFRELGPESLKVPGMGLQSVAGLRVRGYETERLFSCCVVRSRFDPFEVCPGVGIVVTAVVACELVYLRFPSWYLVVIGELMEKMGQPIRTRNLKKSGFSLVGNVWIKTSVAEGRAIIGEASTAEVQEEDVVVREDEPLTSVRRIKDIAVELIVPFGQSSEGVIPPPVPAPAAIQESVDDSVESVAHTEGEHVDAHMEETPTAPVEEVDMEESHKESITKVMAPGHIEDVHMEDAPTQGEPTAQG